MTARPLVTVQGGNPVKLPYVFVSPIRSDIVTFIHTLMNKNHRQPYAVKDRAGMGVAAESWGTGRAVSRIPRVPGGGTSRSGQGAFGNMCRGGRMFAPTRTWRRWHRKISQGQRRYATCSALAASAVPSLVLARGHRIEQLPEIPLVIADTKFDGMKKTKQAVKLLQEIKADEDVQKVKDSRHIRCGAGKARNRRYVKRKGPLIIHNKNRSFTLPFRNIPGIELCHVSRLNLLTLAPGGHLGRFIIWTESAFKALDSIFGTDKQDSKMKIGFRPPRAIITNADIPRIINSEEVQRALNVRKKKKFIPRHKNAVKNLGALVKLNPYALTQRRRAILACRKEKKEKKARKTALERKNKFKKSRKFQTILHAPAIAPVRSDLEKVPRF